LISVWGFSDSIPKLLSRLAELISSYEPTEEKFENMRDLSIQRNSNYQHLQSAQIVQNERLNYTMEGTLFVKTFFGQDS
jgi:secreted Zn-dependent insulinase-like peptidase